MLSPHRRTAFWLICVLVSIRAVTFASSDSQVTRIHLDPEVIALYLYNLDTQSDVRLLWDWDIGNTPQVIDLAVDTVDEDGVPFDWNIRTEVQLGNYPLSHVEYTLSGDAAASVIDNATPWHFPADQTALNLGRGRYLLASYAVDIYGNGCIIPGTCEPASFHFYVIDSATLTIDLNDDGYITPADAVYVANRVGSGDLRADVDHDGDIDTDDFDLVIGALGGAVTE